MYGFKELIGIQTDQKFPLPQAKAPEVSASNSFGARSSTAKFVPYTTALKHNCLRRDGIGEELACQHDHWRITRQGGKFPQGMHF